MLFIPAAVICGVIFFDNNLNLIGDTDTLDLDPRSFTNRLDIIEFEILSEEKTKEIIEQKNINIGFTQNIFDTLVENTTLKKNKLFQKHFNFIC